MAKKNPPFLKRKASLSFDSSSLLTVNVGQGAETKAFVVNKDMVAANSTFFRTAIHGLWEESHEKVVNLPTNDPDIFHLWLIFVYRGELETPEIGKGRQLKTDGEQTITVTDEGYLVLSNVYILSDMLGDSLAKNAVITRILNSSGLFDESWLPGIKSLKIAYEETPEKSALRRLFFALWYGVPTKDLIYYIDEFPQQFVRDYVISLADDTGGVRKPRKKFPKHADFLEKPRIATPVF
ncbi:hypothetical protein B0J11DRAFT_3560 [Dendryphion nanum]|uniref:BTB domain-containing protein n=1 Tax=Dendryphion nanum TaxID=256645 RepID=A0A9P9IZP5_9PLEO|nr:hypothetical protein B0J11DRAFT_3560 [Dendryphion nanum]